MYNTDFPKPKSLYLKAEMFQDREIPLVFKGWKKKANEDDPPTRRNAQTWKQKMKYQLRYSYPEFAIDEVGQQRLGSDGKPFRNAYYDPNFPQGYSIVYAFDEGDFESGSKPLFEAFCMLSPKSGERILIKRTGADKETKWSVKRATIGDVHPQELPEIQTNELDPDSEVPWEQGN